MDEVDKSTGRPQYYTSFKVCACVWCGWVWLCVCEATTDCKVCGSMYLRCACVGCGWVCWCVLEASTGCKMSGCVFLMCTYADVYLRHAFVYYVCVCLPVLMCT